MREPENIQQVTELGIDLMGFIFWPKSPRYVKSVTVKAGIVPNLPNSKVTRNAKKVKRVVAIRDGKISSERILKESYAELRELIDESIPMISR